MTTQALLTRFEKLEAFLSSFITKMDQSQCPTIYYFIKSDETIYSDENFQRFFEKITTLTLTNKICLNREIEILKDDLMYFRTTLLCKNLDEWCFIAKKMRKTCIRTIEFINNFSGSTILASI